MVISRVIAGVSGSPYCLPALRYAADVARAHDVPFIPVLAWSPVGERSRPAYAPTIWVDWTDGASIQLQAVLQVAFGGLPAGVRTEPMAVRGQPGRTLVGIANRSGDLLVVGAGRRFWPGHGKVCRYCLAHAVCPVVAVPAALPDRAGRWYRRPGKSLRPGGVLPRDQ
jgi:nucleotide-binding universal stress UspA family protein